MPNPDNLIGKGFKKGESGNPAGRPPGKSISSILKELLEGTIKNASGEVKTRAEVLALTLLEKGIKNKDLKAIEQILDRTEGKPQQKIDTTIEMRELTIVRKTIGNGNKE